MPRPVALLLLFTGLLSAQTLKFEVASLKPALSPIQLRDKGIRPRQPVRNPGRFEMYNVSMRVLLREAYRLEPYQKISGADWIDSEFYEVAATLPEGSRQDQTPEMLQALLAERCGFAVHWESREEMAYALSVAGDGPKLKIAADSETSEQPKEVNGRAFVAGGTTANGWIGYYESNGMYVLEVHGATIQELMKSFLPREVDGPLLDLTGLTGRYDISLPVAAMWLRKVRDPNVEPDPAGVDLAKSFEKVGLKLEHRKVPIRHLVIDHAEKVPR